MWMQCNLRAGKLCLSIALLGTVVVVAGCARNKTEQVALPPASLTTDSSIVTGSIATPDLTEPSTKSTNNPGTVTGVTTVALSRSKTAVATRTKPNKLSLAFPKKGYALSGEQSAQLAGFVRDAKKNNKRVKVVGIATSARGSKSKHAQNKAREEANRRAKATSMFLRVYGLEDKDMTVTTVDQKPRKGASSRLVEVLIQ